MGGDYEHYYIGSTNGLPQHVFLVMLVRCVAMGLIADGDPSSLQVGLEAYHEAVISVRVGEKDLSGCYGR